MFISYAQIGDGFVYRLKLELDKKCDKLLKEITHFRNVSLEKLYFIRCRACFSQFRGDNGNTQKMLQKPVSSDYNGNLVKKCK